MDAFGIRALVLQHHSRTRESERAGDRPVYLISDRKDKHLFLQWLTCFIREFAVKSKVPMCSVNDRSKQGSSDIGIIRKPYLYFFAASSLTSKEWDLPHA
ncbi:hypothetical protein D3C76_1350640 [compost metagenome]